jgi:hypothetical protein
LNGQQIISGIVWPGTSFRITNDIAAITLTAQQATLAAGDYIQFYQFVEGSRLRELVSDVHSVSLLVSCTQPLKFGLRLASQAGPNYTLTKLCQITTANQWTLITLPNLPLWAPGATWSVTPGVKGYVLGLILAAGSTYMSPANDTWQAGNFVGALGQDNFAALPVNSVFYAAFVQHEPGPYCSPGIDLPFEDNLRSCKRYYSKSNGYTKVTPTANDWSLIGQALSGTSLRANIVFTEEMAVNPTVTIYDNAVTPNAVYIDALGISAAIGTGFGTTTRGVPSLATAAAFAAGGNLSPVLGQWKDDTGW